MSNEATTRRALHLMVEVDRPTPELVAKGAWQEGFDLTQAEARVELAALESELAAAKAGDYCLEPGCQHPTSWQDHSVHSLSGIESHGFFSGNFYKNQETSLARQIGELNAKLAAAREENRRLREASDPDLHHVDDDFHMMAEIAKAEAALADRLGEALEGVVESAHRTDDLKEWSVPDGSIMGAGAALAALAERRGKK